MWNYYTYEHKYLRIRYDTKNYTVEEPHVHLTVTILVPAFRLSLSATTLVLRPLF